MKLLGSSVEQSCVKSISVGSLISKIWCLDTFLSNKLVVKKDPLPLRGTRYPEKRYSEIRAMLPIGLVVGRAYLEKKKKKKKKKKKPLKRHGYWKEGT